MAEVKICGITNSSDAKNAITAGANYLGFIFVPGSARAINEEAAQEVLKFIGGQVKTVAVFRNSEIADVKRIAKALKFDYVQLHGSESPEFCQSVGAPIVKVIEIDPDSDDAKLQELLDLYKSCDYILFDKPKQLDFATWLDVAIEKVENLRVSRPYFFAGGLNHTNVRRVLSRIKPHALDVASGVEVSPGLKDMDKMIAFCGAVSDGANVVNEAIS
ncbi:MAG: phosphoribosylanthranilate isomerase [Cyanobacteria bacterium SZAS-4]|nr:phosphoribosylanthranilate isomerase [Cyanobacteria bacterium SZAS-4]